MNEFGAPVLDAEGNGINYTREELLTMELLAGTTNASVSGAEPLGPTGFVPPSGAARPFWQYAIFGSGIGASNIIIGPAPAGGGAREIIIGSAIGFWQVLRYNSTTGDYDQLFVSPTYGQSYYTTIKRIALGNVIGDSKQEIAVMLADGRIFLYDLATKADLGHITTGITGLEALSLTDLTSDGTAELIVTTGNDLYVFNNTGTVLWQLAGAGGGDVVVGQMDMDPAPRDCHDQGCRYRRGYASRPVDAHRRLRCSAPASAIAGRQLPATNCG